MNTNSETRFDDTFIPRMTDDEVRDIVQGIAPLRRMFREGYEGDLFGARDYTDGILYLSRVNVEAHHPETKESNRPDSTKKSEVSKDLQEIESESYHIATFNMEKKRRFAMSLATLASKSSKRETMCKDGAIQSLIKLSLIDDIPIRKCCAAAFSFLASDSKVRPLMTEPEVFKAIINLSSVNNRVVKTDCCRALCNLCCEEMIEARAVRENTPNAIIQIAQAVPSTLEISLQTLVNLSCVTEKYQKVEDVTDCLMHFTLPTFHLGEKEEILLISAMCNLSAVRNNQLRLVENHCLRVLERTVKSSNPTLRILSAEVVRNLTTEVRTRSKVMDQNIVVILVGMAKDELEQVKTACVHSFHNLARDVSCREKIVAGGAVSVIIKMSIDKTNNVDLDRTAARTLRILCGDRSDRSLVMKLVRDGIVKALMSLIKTDDNVIRQYCAESICSLFQNDSVLARLIDQGAVGVLVQLSDNNTDEITGEWCAFALYHLATNKLCPPSMLANGILPCLIKLCDKSTIKTKQFCGAALRSITQQKVVEASSAIPILVHMLRYETDQIIKANCASALYNLAENDRHCDHMLSAGALMPVVRLTQSEYLETKIKCAAILSRLSLHEQYYEQFGREDVLRVLLDLSCLEHTLTQQRVVIAMSNLTQFQSLRLMLLNLHAPKYIIALASKPDEQIRRGCSAIICNLSYDYGGERNMVAGGVLSTLLITALVTSDQVETKVICIKALVNLQCDRSLYRNMVDQGLIWGLSTLALIDDEDIMMLCSKALCNLSYDFAKDMLTSGVAIRAVVKLLRQDNIVMQKNGGRALTNLLLQTKDTDEEFRRKAVIAMEPMASSKDEEVVEMCIIGLCLASQSDACRESIVEKRMIRKIDASTIFNKPTVSYAYLTMFGNIANNPNMRTQLLDEFSMDRFLHICNAHDASLDMAVAKALYSISCAPQNIPKLAEQRTLTIITTIWNAEYNKTLELVQYLIACLYNMTTHADVQASLVSQGIVAMIAKLWSRAMEEYNMCRLACTAVCQLACGVVNSAKMVKDGCAPIICFVTSHRYQTKYAQYHFPAGLSERCAAALRNILCLIPNQSVMAQAGVIKTLMDLALPEKEFMPLPSQSIRHNCASALRSLSYNIDMRELLVASGAIGIILADHNLESDPDLAMNSNLLKELEAESWSNGSRGPQKESKAPPMEPSPIYQSLLGGTSDVVLDVPKTYSELQKYMVYVYLEEPPIETEEQNLKGLDLNLKDLQSFKEEDRPEVMYRLGPKRPAELPDEPLHRRYLMEVDDDRDEGYSRHSEYSSDFEGSDGSPSSSQANLNIHRINEQQQHTTNHTHSTNNTNKSSHHTVDKSIQNRKVSNSVSFVDSSGLPLMSSAVDGETQNVRRKYSSSKLSSTAPGRIELPSLSKSTSSSSLSTTKNKKANKDELFKGLVALINHSKAKGDNIDAVVDRWTSMSKY